MPTCTNPRFLSSRNLTILFLGFSFCCSIGLNAQYIINEPLMESVSIQEHAEIANTGTADFSIEEIINQKSNIRFSPLSDTGENIGFTTANYWVKFQIKNDTDEQLNYFLETARPIIDSLTLYSIANEGKVNVQENGDAIAFKDKSVPHRKSIFKIAILPTETYTGYLNIKNKFHVW